MNSSSHELFELLLLFFRAILRREQGMRSYGSLSLPQVVLLDALAKRPQCKMRELASLLGIGMSSATGLADRMVKGGLIARRRDLEDRRVVWVSIAPKGRLLFKQFRQARQKTFGVMFRNLSAKERTLFLSLFKRISQNLQEAAQ